MLDSEETAELRTLHAKAYRRDGGLSAAEILRLSELEVRRVARPVEERGSSRDGTLSSDQDVPSQQPPAPSLSDPLVDRVPVFEREETPDVETAEPQVAARAERDVTRRRRWMLLGAAAAVLVVGVGVGWFLFGRDAGPAIPITAEQQVRGTELAEEGNYDSGTMIPIDEDEDVLIWMASRNEGETTCLVLDNGEANAESCDLTERISETGLHGMLTLPTDENSEYDQEIVSASLAFARDGQPMIQTMRGWNSGGIDFLEQFADAEERAMAERILDAGYDDWSPQIAGYDGEVPIWIASREYGQEVCIFYGTDVDGISACGSMETAQTTGLGFGFSQFDEEGTEPTSSRMVTLRYSPQGFPSIVISDGSSSGITPDTLTGQAPQFLFGDQSRDPDD